MTNAHDTFIFTEMASILKAIHPSFKNHPLGFTVLKNQEDPGFDLQVKWKTTRKREGETGEAGEGREEEN